MAKVKRFQIQIKGLRDYLQHRRPDTIQEIEKAKEITKILQKNGLDEKAGAQEAELGAYQKNGKAYLPSDHLSEAMAKAATQIRVGGQGKKTYKDYFKSYVFIEPNEIPLTPSKWQVHRSYVKIQRQGIWRYRPVYKDWSAKFDVIVTDESIPSQVVREVLETAGLRVGVGDYRPKFGLFSVSGFDEIEK
jgi:hypothetical protein